jgi:hypothetical protein
VPGLLSNVWLKNSKAAANGFGILEAPTRATHGLLTAVS